ncbi:DUF2461 domain-containing protein [Fulvivirgaceae bacterium BMA10]|uniref:DUF2461 domain-containing protein n=1 Tax=Splendidivirga corallicola TaxID=3051826 RepID=A0ABT8KTR7_9BACT|nr:DUF2461 domain-containing protein [Fulvivirgaceae bacterium BMA10]
MSNTFIQSYTFEFLKQLKENNHREWFNAHKKDYEKAHQNVIAFAEDLIHEMNQYDNIETASGKKSLYRIYRDVRFSKDKTPYKSNWGGGMRRATKWLRGGYYYQIEPGNTFIMGGFFGPNAEDLKHIRQQIAQDDEPLRAILDDQKFKDYFGSLRGSCLKTAPKGFEKDHPSIDLLRYKQFLLKHSFTDAEALSEDFVSLLAEGFNNMRPFFDYMSEILTTDLNGVPME